MPQSDSSIWWKRRGILGVWLAFTAPPRPVDMSELKTREYIRRAELISISSIMILVFLIGLVSNSLSDPSTAIASEIMAIVTIVALTFNHHGKINIAASLIIIFMMLVLIMSIVGAKGGLRLTWFITYDLFCIPIFLSALIIHKNAAIVTALLGDAFIIADFFLQPHAQILVHGYLFDEIQWEIIQPFFHRGP